MGQRHPRGATLQKEWKNVRHSARTFWYKVQAGNVGVSLGIAAAMAYLPLAGQKDSFFGTMHGQGRDAVQFFTDSKVVITRW